jgi:WD40 repeat protein
VYGLGSYSDGRPFYAMRFIKGDSLKEALAEFHSSETVSRQKPSERQFQLRNLLRRFVDVCNAVDYAHARGVLHRDLKPGNIMLGKYGETLIVDWGLAKSVGRKEITNSEMTFHPASPLSSTGMTRPGSAIGTPAYMSPEQAAGRLDEMGTASDVYSLGATLYHILTGHPPFDGMGLGFILQKVQKGDFVRPRQRNPAIPSALDSICLKAMALRPEDRYSSPRALADDVEHWLADEPVTASKETWRDRLNRLVRKQQGYVHAGLAGLLAVTLVSIAAVLLIDLERRKNKTIADEKTVLASEKTVLATENAQLAQGERLARNAAEGRAIDLRRSLAWSYLDRGLDEHDKGFLDASAANLRQAWAQSTDDDPLADSYRRIIVDRLSQSNRQYCAPVRHPDDVLCVAFSSDGTRVVSGCSTGEVRISDARTGAVCGQIMQHSGEVFSVSFSPDGTRIVSGSFDNSAQLWDGQSGAPIGKRMRHSGPVISVNFSPDGTRLVSGGGSTLRQWNSQTGEPIGAPMRHAEHVLFVAYSPDGARIVSGCTREIREDLPSTGFAQLWNAQTGAKIGAPMQHHTGIRALQFSPDGTYIVSGCSRTYQNGNFLTTLYFWDGNTGTALEGLSKGEASTDSIDCLAISPDNKYLVSGSDAGEIQVWNLASRTIQTEQKLAAAVEYLEYSPDGSRFLSTCSDGTLQLWRIENGKVEPIGEVMRLPSSTNGVAFSPDGSRFVSGGDDSLLRFWTGNNGPVLAESMQPFEPEEQAGGGTTSFQCFELSPDTSLVAVTDSSHEKIRIWSIEKRAEVGKPLDGKLHMMARFSPDRTRLLSASLDETLGYGMCRQVQLLEGRCDI